MAAKAFKVELKRIKRGDHSHKGFFISTFRFDLPLAQAIELRARAEGLSISSVINQVLQAWVDNTPAPKGLKPMRTKSPTLWGVEPKKGNGKDKVGVARKVGNGNGKVLADKSKPKAKAALSVLAKLKSATAR